MLILNVASFADSADYSGTVDIDVAVYEQIDELFLHVNKLEIHAVNATTADGQEVT